MKGGGLRTVDNLSAIANPTVDTGVFPIIPSLSCCGERGTSDLVS